MPKNSEAKIKANNKYASKTYKRYAINTRLEYVPKIEAYGKQYGFDSASGVFNAAIRYVVDNDIPLSPAPKKSWSDEVFEHFIDMAGLTEFEQGILESRIEGLTIKQQAAHFNCSTSKISTTIKRIKLMYDALQLQHPDKFPQRKSSEKETYQDEN